MASDGVGPMGKVTIFDKPFASVVLNQQVENVCGYCFQRPNGKTCKRLQICGGCHWYRYCNRACQRASWKEHHKLECARLQLVFPNLPVTEVLFLGRICDRLRFIEANGDLKKWQAERRFDELMSHEEEIRQDKEKMKHFELIYEKAQKFLASAIPKREQFFLIFCRSWINSHSIHSNTGVEVGMALDLGISKYDHSCRPNTAMVFNGFRAVLRPLVNGIDTTDPSQCFIAYVDVGRSRYQRRKELQSKWYFWCECERCRDPCDDRLTSIRCVNVDCSEPVCITEDQTNTKNIQCRRCGSKMPENVVIEAQCFMLALPQHFGGMKSAEELHRLKIYLNTAERLLHKENIYFCRLLTAYLQLTEGVDSFANNLELQKSVYSNYRRCLPAADRHVGFQLLHIVRTLIMQNRRAESIPYAHEAMRIFEICFGLDHPYYLQTLALWTFLENGSKKTNEELFKLMNFTYSKPVNLEALFRHCRQHDNCIGLSLCTDGKCTAAIPTDITCESQEYCYAHQVCRFGICLESSVLPRSGCLSHADCEGQQLCVKGRCKVALPVGGFCLDNSQCGRMLTCKFNHSVHFDKNDVLKLHNHPNWKKEFEPNYQKKR
ncbi:SET domain-containing protein 14 [Trichinella pseudospiralis]|uniref:SET domain-containing protein 14 n=3 Tax=Trichinella pseudospiralis TaxID=6337 RepID=A0A0V0XUJ7_TRIPS|nr:SET domain-containing protein 14 [Trichinella pseudospiralis]KRY67582.1 SET domain-containing protein 14 [Trichinella pseudospiralis]KRY86129.1 SET domain-containing protein 14 [Trichinella pseudospiralis]KRZ24736.1 SET domain-containing protein 14 [Trichinella pseudospiralis]KRZ30438.1 SET domain-containing protein 14 [Trichinella pseudospiralis]